MRPSSLPPPSRPTGRDNNGEALVTKEPLLAAAPALLGLCLGLCLSPSSAAAATGTKDPDGGLARGYFEGLKPRPLSVQPAGKEGGNVIFLVVDALRPDHMGLYGYDKARERTTPFLDEWSKDAFVFLHHHANAPWTRPSTASMLTGLYPSKHRTQTDESKLPAGIRTLPMDMKALGYQTTAVVGNGNGSSIAGLERGFDDYVDTTTAWKKLPNAKQIFDDALAWTDKEREKDKPFFMFLFAVDPHDPYRAPPAYEARFLPKGFEGEPRRRAHWEYQNDYPKKERDSMIAVYDAAIRYTDDQIKRFFGELDKRGLLENTTVIITADHGDGFGEHGYYLHAHHHYDEIIRVPLLVKTPAYRGNGTVFHTTQSIDLAPTIVALAGGKPRPELPGKPLFEMMRAPVDPARLVLTEYKAFGIHRSSLYNQRYRVILQLPADEEEFLRHIPRKELLPSVSFDKEVLHVYARQTDPRDRNNLAGKGSLPKEAAELRDKLKGWMLRSPRSNGDVDVKKMNPSALQDLRDLGYVQ